MVLFLISCNFYSILVSTNENNTQKKQKKGTLPCTKRLLERIMAAVLLIHGDNRRRLAITIAIKMMMKTIEKDHKLTAKKGTAQKVTDQGVTS